MPLSLEDAVAQALSNNLGLRIDRLDTTVSAAGVESADAAFDTTLYASGRLGAEEADNKGRPQPIPLQDADGNIILGSDGEPVIVPTVIPSSSDSRSYEAGARKRIRLTNAAVQIQTALSRNSGSTYNSSLGQVVGGSLGEEASLSVSVTQPILRGFGRDIAEAPLERARAADRATQLRVKSSALDVIERTETAYWNLATAEARLEMRRSNRALAQSLLEEMRERERLGLATRLDVIQSEANLAQREDDIIVAEQAVQESNDALTVLLGGLQQTPVEASNFAVDTLPPPPADLPPLQEVWQSALHSDQQVAAQEEVLLQQEINVRVARDALKPELNLTLSGSFSGISDENASEAYELLRDRDTTGWGVQLAFEMPLGRRAATAGVRSASAQLEQSEWTLAQLKQNLLRAVRTAHRELEARQKRLRSAELVLRLQEETFERERTKLDEGLSTVRDVLEIQSDLDAARLALLDAQASAILAELNLDRLRGHLLERHHLTWEQAAPETVP